MSIKDDDIYRKDDFEGDSDVEEDIQQFITEIEETPTSGDDSDYEPDSPPTPSPQKPKREVIKVRKGAKYVEVPVYTRNFVQKSKKRVRTTFSNLEILNSTTHESKTLRKLKIDLYYKILKSNKIIISENKSLVLTQAIINKYFYKLKLQKDMEDQIKAIFRSDPSIEKMF